MLDFSQKAEEKNNDLIPKGTLLWAVLNCRGLKNSSKGGRYLDIELTIEDGQPFARRKIWTMIGDPLFAGNSEAYRNMGLSAIRRILEVAFGATPDSPDSYKVMTDYSQLTGQIVAVKVAEKKGQDGYDDKNDVEFLSPHSSIKSVVKAFEDLKAGVHAPAGAAAKPGAAKAPAPATGFSGFAQAPAPAASAKPAWLGQGQPAQPATSAKEDDIPFS